MSRSGRRRVPVTAPTRTRPCHGGGARPSVAGHEVGLVGALEDQPLDANVRGGVVVEPGAALVAVEGDGNLL
jgi:hypothetical protein